MDPEAGKPDEFEAKIKILTNIVMSLARSSSEHDERLAGIEEQISRLLGVADDLVQVSTNHQQTISRLLDITRALADSAVTHDRQLAEQRENLDVLTRTVDDWIRRNPRNSSAT